jgi:hypothetical protein
MNQREELLTLARYFISFGIPVFPVDADTKAPLEKGLGGFKSATTDIDKLVERLSRLHGNIGWGLWPGPGGYVALDVDNKNGKSGTEELDKLELQYGKLPNTAVVLTPSGGYHILYKKGDVVVGNADLAPGINIRADDGYIVAAGTTKSDGTKWQWIEGRELDKAVEWPAWIADLLTGTGKVTGKDHWQEFARDKVTPVDLAMVDLLMTLGFKMPTIQNDSVYLVAPHKTNGVGVSVGQINPGVAMIWDDSCEMGNGKCLPHGQHTPGMDVEDNGVFSIDELKYWLQHGTKRPQLKLKQRFVVDEDDEGFPVPNQKAFYGPLGKLVGLVENASEADPMFLMVTLLTGVGVLIGKGPTVHAGELPQPLNMFAVMVGDTASGKGGSWGLSKRILKMIDGDFFESSERVVSGFGSGEVVVKTAAELESTTTVKGTDIVIGGDSRMLIKESEFAKVLRVSQREGTTLGQIMCDAYDGESMQYRTVKQGTMVADSHHIGVLAHITPTELLDTMSTVEAANGFGNRFMWVLGVGGKSVPTASDELDYTEEELNELSDAEREMLLHMSYGRLGRGQEHRVHDC